MPLKPGAQARLFPLGAAGLLVMACGNGNTSSTGGTPTIANGGASGAAGAVSAATGGTSGGAAGSEAAGGTSSTGGTGGAAGVGCVVTTPPDGFGPVPVMTPGAPAGDGTSTNIQAVDKLFLGDTDRTGVAFPKAWAHFGFPISGKIYKDAKTGAATHCKPLAGAKPNDVIVNGSDGTDNSFGKNVLPIILGLASDATQQIQQSIAAGGFSVLFRIEKLGSSTDYDFLPSVLYWARGTDDGLGGTLAPPPSDWSAYVWHPLDSQKTGLSFPTSYLAKNTWVSGCRQDVSFTLSIAGHDLALLLHLGQIATQFSADHGSTTNGQIGGVLATTNLVDAFAAIAGKISPALCSSDALMSVLGQIKQASDIGIDGQQDPTKTCDGISIGLGFETTRAQLGDPAPAMTPTALCP